MRSFSFPFPVAREIIFTKLWETQVINGVNLTASLQWNDTNPLQFPYIIDVSGPDPSLHNTTMTGGTVIIDLEVQYNKLYNVSVVEACEPRLLYLIGLYYCKPKLLIFSD